MEGSFRGSFEGSFRGSFDGSGILQRFLIKGSFKSLLRVLQGVYKSTIRYYRTIGLKP